MDKLNIVALAGNLASSPELSATPTGTPVLRFTVAVTNKVRDKRIGRLEDRPVFIPCVLYGDYATAIEPTLKKGTGVVVQGALGNFAPQDRGRMVNVVVDTCIPVKEVPRKRRADDARSSEPNPVAAVAALASEPSATPEQEPPATTSQRDFGGWDWNGGLIDFSECD